MNLGLLFGDANGDRFVNSGDAVLTRNSSGQLVEAANLRADYNGNGTVNAADATIARAQSGTYPRD